MAWEGAAVAPNNDNCDYGGPPRTVLFQVTGTILNVQDCLMFNLNCSTGEVRTLNSERFNNQPKSHSKEMTELGLKSRL